MPDDKSPPIGPIGQNVVRNVEDLRRSRGLSLRELSDRLAAIGRPILSTVLHRLGQGKRRVDADDLVALALVLGVNPSALLLDRDAHDNDMIELAPEVRQRSYAVWKWVDGAMPLPEDPVPPGLAAFETPSERALDFQRYARPHGGLRDWPPMIAEIYDLLLKWEIAYQDWANPDTYDMRVRHLHRQIQRLILRSEDELDRLGQEGAAAERERLHKWR